MSAAGTAIEARFRPHILLRVGEHSLPQQRDPSSTYHRGTGGRIALRVQFGSFVVSPAELQELQADPWVEIRNEDGYWNLSQIVNERRQAYEAAVVNCAAREADWTHAQASVDALKIALERAEKALAEQPKQPAPPAVLADALKQSGVDFKKDQWSPAKFLDEARDSIVEQARRAATPSPEMIDKLTAQAGLPKQAPKPGK